MLHNSLPEGCVRLNSLWINRDCNIQINRFKNTSKTACGAKGISVLKNVFKHRLILIKR